MQDKNVFSSYFVSIIEIFKIKYLRLLHQIRSIGSHLELGLLKKKYDNNQSLIIRLYLVSCTQAESKIQFGLFIIDLAKGNAIKQNAANVG